jgi:acyl-CoA synthetase (AMP-forming)/AMP-acid ligase II/aryl carrier-like protein
MDLPAIPHWLTIQAEFSSEANAVLAPGRVPLTYGRLAEQVASAIRQLNDLGIGRNDRLAVVLPNGPEMALTFLSIASAATSAPLNPAYSASEFDFYLSDLDARALVIMVGDDSPAVAVARTRDIPVIEIVPSTDGPAGLFTLCGRGGPLAASAGPAQPDDVALVLHTSGTTARPKMVPLTHRNLCASAESIRQSLQLTARDRCLNVMPLFHIHGLVAALLASLSAGASVVCTPGFYAPQFFPWLEALQPTWYTAVPTMHQAILARATANQEVIAQAHLRFVRSSSASLAPQLMAELERTFNTPVIEAYGMTEASHQMASNPLPPGVRKPGSVGVAAGPEVAIMAEDGDRLLPAREVGEIVIRGPNVMRGYASNPEANARAFTRGWFRTGDQGHMDDEGYLYITGRLKEIINRGGEKISPREIDEVLMHHPAVAQAVTFALPDADLGEDVAAAVILSEASVTEKELRRFASLRLAPFKVPRRIVTVDEIPNGPTGKIQRIGLAERLGLTVESGIPAPAPGTFVPPSTDVEKLLAEMWCEVLGLPSVSVQARFLDLGGDSILAMRLVARLRQIFEVNLTLLDFFDAPTVAEQALIIEGLLLDEVEALSDEEAGRLAAGATGREDP